MRSFLLCALLAATVLTGANEAPASQKRPTDRQIAARAVLTPADLPRGWTAVDQPQAISCHALTVARDAASGSARSKTFKRGDDTEAQTAVYVFRDAAAAKRRFKSMSGAGTLRCYTERLSSLLSRTSDVEVDKVERAALDIEPAGDQRAAARVTARYTIEGIDVELFVDLVFVRSGRGVSLGAFIDVLSPFDEDLRTDLTAKQVGRL